MKLKSLAYIRKKYFVLFADFFCPCHLYKRATFVVTEFADVCQHSVNFVVMEFADVCLNSAYCMCV